MAHEPKLNRELRLLLQARRVAALGTRGEDDSPLVSMVPFAIEPASGRLVIHVSSLAAHTRNLTARPDVSVLVMQAEVVGEPVHALPRVTFTGIAHALTSGDARTTACRTAYLDRFPDAQPMTQLGDFSFVSIEVTQARQVAGFGAARTLDGEALEPVLRSAHMRDEPRAER